MQMLLMARRWRRQKAKEKAAAAERKEKVEKGKINMQIYSFNQNLNML
jgi:predicted RecB family nuclease